MDQAVLVTADKRKKFSSGLTLLDIEQYGGVGRPEPLTVRTTSNLIRNFLRVNNRVYPSVC